MNPPPQAQAGPVSVLRDVPASEADIPSDARLREFARLALEGAAGELNLRIVSAVESQRLNSQFRGKAKPTNVLSFPAELPEDFPVAILGDLALCAAVIRREAAEQGKSPEAHWAHMIIHGCLHLRGYDHQDDDEAERMEARETALLATLGFADPYLFTEESTDS